MSCTVVAVPFSLAWVIGSIITGNIRSLKDIADIEDDIISDRENIYYANQNDVPDICEDVNIISASDFLEKTLETPFTNKELLLKTIEEHGVQNITEESDKITGNVDNYTLVFKKADAEQSYSLTIRYTTKSNVEEKIADLHSEYAMNVQEDAYLNIIEKLKENHMELEEEEVLDDNTIVLTVNLEG